MEQIDDFFESLFAASPVMAILRGLPTAEAVELAERAWDLGIVAVEVPLQSGEDAATIRELADRTGHAGRVVGAGTIVDGSLLERAREAGAAFTVAPGFSTDVWTRSVALDVPHLPGVATATEVQVALGAGALWLKAFPAARLGPGWVADMHGPFPSARFVATGGLDAHNAGSFLAAGARAVAVGSALARVENLPMLARLVSGRTTP